MATLQIRPRDPVAARYAPVQIWTCDANGKRITAYGPDGIVITDYTGATNAAGNLDVDLTPNSQIQPAGTGYAVQIGDRPPIIIRKASWAQTVYEALATDLGPLSPIVGAQGPQGPAGGGGWFVDDDGYLNVVAPSGSDIDLVDGLVVLTLT